jgi:hypothetical protein
MPRGRTPQREGRLNGSSNARLELREQRNPLIEAHQDAVDGRANTKTRPAVPQGLDQNCRIAIGGEDATLLTSRRSGKFLLALRFADARPKPPPHTAVSSRSLRIELVCTIRRRPSFDVFNRPAAINP